MLLLPPTLPKLIEKDHIKGNEGKLNFIIDKIKRKRKERKEEENKLNKNNVKREKRGWWKFVKANIINLNREGTASEDRMYLLEKELENRKQATYLK